MGLFLRQDEQRSDLQNRVATELQERLRTTDTDKTLNDHEPAFMENKHQTKLSGMIIIVLLVLLMATIVVFALRIA